MDTIHQGTQEEVLFALDRAIQIAFESGDITNIRPFEWSSTGGNCAAYETSFNLDGLDEPVQVMVTGVDVLYYGDGSLADFGSYVTLCMYTDEDMCDPVIPWDQDNLCSWDEDQTSLCCREITDLQSLKTAVVAIIRDHCRYVDEVMEVK
jgi:hypothetical protein